MLMEKLTKLYTVLGWTFLGFISAYIVIALKVFTQLMIIYVFEGALMPSWITIPIALGGGVGLLIGMLKVSDTKIGISTRVD